MKHEMPSIEIACMQVQGAMRAIEQGFDRPSRESCDGTYVDLSALFGVFADYLGAVLEQAEREAAERRQAKQQG